MIEDFHSFYESIERYRGNMDEQNEEKHQKDYKKNCEGKVEHEFCFTAHCTLNIIRLWYGNIDNIEQQRTENHESV